ncbi:MAG: lipid-A-disaccharide synthase [Thermodesulfobacteriota bacterium]|nr:MAG: lipid-A-disaccharide synthase [Thermodesulfobacteriota bacterium]
MSKKIFMVSGEESGDLHGASLIRELKKIIPGLVVKGMGGERMREAGFEGLDSKEVSVVGIVEVIEKSPKILARLKKLKKQLASEAFDAAVFIDFPDFNLRLAGAAKALGIPVIYYVSPQVWAWRRGRIKKIARLVDKMLVVFPFEEPLYREAGVDVEYVGHPLADAVKCGLTPGEACRAVGADDDATVVALLPGSRTAEVKRHLPVMLEAAALIDKGVGGAQFLIPAARSIGDEQFNCFTSGAHLNIKVVRDRLYEALRASSAAVVASGTATLETALIGTPMVIIYRMSLLSYGVGRALVDVEHVGLPNIVAGRRVVEELIQNDATPERISGAVLDILKNSKKRNDIIKGLKEIRESLGGGASRRAAMAVAGIIS